MPQGIRQVPASLVACPAAVEQVSVPAWGIEASIAKVDALSENISENLTFPSQEELCISLLIVVVAAGPEHEHGHQVQVSMLQHA